MQSKKIFLSLLLIASTIAFSACNKSTAETETTEPITEIATAYITEAVTETTTASGSEPITEIATASATAPVTEIATASSPESVTESATDLPEEATAVATEIPSMVARMQQADTTLSELRQYSEFKNATDDKKAELAMTLLNELVYEEIIQKDSIIYNENQRLISFKYIDGTNGEFSL